MGRPAGDCDPFQWNNMSYASASFCGAFEFQMEKEDLMLKRFAFDASALPVPAQMDIFDRVTILRYHSETEFQKVFLLAIRSRSWCQSWDQRLKRQTSW